MSGDSAELSARSEGGFLRKLKASVRSLIHDPAKQIGVKEVRSKQTILHQGWLRKKNAGGMVGKAMNTMNIKWGMFYVLLTDKNIYYYKTETSSSFAGKLSLFGYNAVKRPLRDGNSKFPEFTIMVQHASEDSERCKNYYFSCSHSEEWKTWITKIRKALILANESLVSEIIRRNDDSSIPIDELEHPIYPSTQFTAHAGKYLEDNIDSDDDDYETIPDPDFPPRRNPKVAAKTPSNTESYVDFSSDIPEVGPYKSSTRRPVPPLPSPPRDARYGDQPICSGPISPSKASLPKFLEIESSAASPATNVLTELQEKQQRILNAHKGRDKDSSTPPAIFAPPRPTTQRVSPATPVSKKPTLPVKPRIQERIYWNSAKEDANRVIKSSSIGVFIVRKDSAGQQMVVVISAGEGDAHSIRITNYHDGRMGLKPESSVTEVEKFHSVEEMVKHYKENNIHLRSGTVEIKLTTAAPRCDARLEW